MIHEDMGNSIKRKSWLFTAKREPRGLLYQQDSDVPVCFCGLSPAEKHPCPCLSVISCVDRERPSSQKFSPKVGGGGGQIRS